MIKTAVIAAALALTSVGAVADKYTSGYVKRDGTYVQGHYSTSPNGSRLDNYSTRGNVNPYTGQAGTVNPYGGYNNSYRANQPPPYNSGRTALDQPDPYSMRNGRGF